MDHPKMASLYADLSAYMPVLYASFSSMLTQLSVEHHAAQRRPELLQAALEVFLVKEVCILEARPQHRLIARSHLCNLSLRVWLVHAQKGVWRLPGSVSRACLQYCADQTKGCQLWLRIYSLCHLS